MLNCILALQTRNFKHYLLKIYLAQADSNLVFFLLFSVKVLYFLLFSYSLPLFIYCTSVLYFLFLHIFQASIPQSKFDSVFDAYDDSAICPQKEEFQNTIVGTLDCLQLNIYVPNKASSRNRLPVLVLIYGGGFSNGFANRYLDFFIWSKLMYSLIPVSSMPSPNS